jgi:hypothetical protein
MKLADILNETLDNPLPYTKIGKGLYEIKFDSHRLHIRTIEQKINGYRCMSVLFLNPDAKDGTEMSTTDLSGNLIPVRIFATITKIVFDIKFIEFVFFCADDLDLNIEGKKTKLYKVLLKKLASKGRIGNAGAMRVKWFNKPILYACIRSVPEEDKKDAYHLTEAEIEELAVKFSKFKIS